MLENTNRWTYQLTLEEEALSTQIGWERQKPMLAQPHRNINYFEGDVWETLQHMICVGSEIAFARMMGQNNFTPHVNKFKSKLDLPGYGEIRYAFPQGFPKNTGEPKGLRISDRDDDTLKYALLVGGLAHRTRRKPPDWLGEPYKAIGWMYGHEVKQDKWKYNHNTWYAPPSELRKLLPQQSLVKQI
jgi:hypothetical protein